MIEVSHLFHDYTGKGQYAVSDVSFAISKGEIFGFLGPSGAGKSTVQNIMTGLLRLQKGEVLYDGKPVNRLGAGFFVLTVLVDLASVLSGGIWHE